MRCARTTLDRPLDYAVPEDFPAVEVGDLVSVELRGRRVEAWVVGANPPAPGRGDLQPLRRWLGHAVSSEVVALAAWAAWRWRSRSNRFLVTASPRRRLRELPVAAAWPAALPLGEPWATSAAEAMAAGGGLLELPAALDPLEVVRGAASACLGKGSLLVLVPEHGWAERLAARLTSAGIPAVTTEAEGSVRAGWPVVVGTRSAAFAPVPVLAGVVVLDAADEAYAEEGVPTWNALAVLAHRCEAAGVALLATSAFRAGNLRPLTPRPGPEPGGVAAGAIVVVDQRERDPREGCFSAPMVHAAKVALAAADARTAGVVAVLNQRGRVALLACRSCRSVVRCERCGGPMASAHAELTCRRCHEHRPEVCASCGSTSMRALRLGVTGAAEQLGALLGRSVATVEGPGGGAVSAAEVVLGTEAALHRLRRAGLVAFLDFDQHLHATRMGATEDALALLVRALRLVARVEGGKVLVQTRDPGHPLLVALAEGGVAGLLDAEDALRAELRLPPYVAQAVVRGEGAEAAADLGAVDLGDGRFLLEAPTPEELCDLLARNALPDGVKVAVDPRAI